MFDHTFTIIHEDTISHSPWLIYPATKKNAHPENPDGHPHAAYLINF